MSVHSRSYDGSEYPGKNYMKWWHQNTLNGKLLDNPDLIDVRTVLGK